MKPQGFRVSRSSSSGGRAAPQAHDFKRYYPYGRIFMLSDILEDVLKKV